MQLTFIASIVFALLAIAFAFQNDVPVTLTLGPWYLDGSLAVVLLVATGSGALIASLLSTPSVVRNQSAANTLRRKVNALEERNVALERRVRELDRLPTPDSAAPLEPVRSSPRLGLRSALFHRRSAQ